MIGMHPSLSPSAEKQRARARRKQKEQYKRQVLRSTDVYRQQQRAAVNIVRFIERRYNGVICAQSLQLLVLEFATTRDVTHSIVLRKSGAMSHLELMTIAVRTLIDERRLMLHEDESGAMLGLPLKAPPPPEHLHVASPVIEPDLDFDWYTLHIVNCREPVLRALAEY